jgi:hypothetical protein
MNPPSAVNQTLSKGEHGSQASLLACLRLCAAWPCWRTKPASGCERRVVIFRDEPTLDLGSLNATLPSNPSSQGSASNALQLGFCKDQWH